MLQKRQHEILISIQYRTYQRSNDHPEEWRSSDPVLCLCLVRDRNWLAPLQTGLEVVGDGNTHQEVTDPVHDLFRDPCLDPYLVLVYKNKKCKFADNETCLNKPTCLDRARCPKGTFPWSRRAT